MNDVKNSVALTWQEKREGRFKRWMSPPGLKFVSPEAEQNYKERTTRLTKAFKLEIPDRVPCMLPAGFFPAQNAGITFETASNDYDAMKKAWLKFLEDYDTDTFDEALYYPSKIYEFLNYKVNKWPGHGLPHDAPTYQFVEQEYMKAEEYDVFLKDPFDFIIRHYLPRAWGVFEPFKNTGSFSSHQALPFRLLSMLNDPSFRPAFEAIWEASKEFPKWQAAVADTTQRAHEMGFPSFRGGYAVAPFDTLADGLRGTKGIVMDMYRQPEKIHEALEKVWPDSLATAVNMADFTGCPMVMMPLHKGDDTFMSNEQYETFYWPTFRRLLLGMIDEGLMPLLVAEGIYNNRLEIIKDLPRSGVMWIFDRTDMARAKQILSGIACIAGNVPVSLAYASTAQEMKDYCRKLIETCAPDGGFILTGGSTFDMAKPENLRAMMEAAKEYGGYEK